MTLHDSTTKQQLKISYRQKLQNPYVLQYGGDVSIQDSLFRAVRKKWKRNETEIFLLLLIDG